MREAEGEDKRQPPGPEPERLRIEGYDDWTDAVREGLKKPRPKEGWPKESGKKKGRQER